MLLELHETLICTDRTGMRLAYAEADMSLHLFDAVTLQPVGSFWPPAGTVSRSDGADGLHLGMYSCWFTTGSDYRGGTSHMCRLEPSMSVLGKVISARALAVSEDDAFFAACVCVNKQITIQIFHMCSGAMALAHETGLPGDDMAVMEMTWFGSCLLVKVNADIEGICTDHIIVLQF